MARQAAATLSFTFFMAERAGTEKFDYYRALEVDRLLVKALQ